MTNIMTVFIDIISVNKMTKYEIISQTVHILYRDDICKKKGINSDSVISTNFYCSGLRHFRLNIEAKKG